MIFYSGLRKIRSRIISESNRKLQLFCWNIRNKIIYFFETLVVEDVKITKNAEKKLSSVRTYDETAIFREHQMDSVKNTEITQKCCHRRQVRNPEKI